MPFGVPVVPDENMITKGVLKGTCSKVSGKTAACDTKSSNLTLQ